MNDSKSNLSQDDKHAIDLLLDHGATAADSAITRLAVGASSAGISAATQTLNALGNFQSAEPPSDLISRTLARIYSFTDSYSPTATTRSGLPSGPFS